MYVLYKFPLQAHLAAHKQHHLVKHLVEVGTYYVNMYVEVTCLQQTAWNANQV